MSSRSSIARRKTKQGRRRGTDLRKIRRLQFAFLGAAFTVAAAYLFITEMTMSGASPEAADIEVTSALPSNFETSALPRAHEPLLSPKVEISSDTFEEEQARWVATFDALVEHRSSDLMPPKQNFSLLAYYVFSEIPPAEKPADTFLKTTKAVPVGTPVEEIKRASDAFGLDFSFMKAVAKIESNFNPKQRTGSYIGLFQLSKYEFKRYGSGSITDPRDNSVAGAYKFATEALLFEHQTGRKATFSDLYLIHQQGWQGAAEHVSHPKRIAWKSMCATEEGKEKGERWCKRAIWGNTLPAIKQAWKSVAKLPSSAFVGMWQQRVDTLYSRYAEATTKN
jgi:Transglycosylase SLT domain